MTLLWLKTDFDLGMCIYITFIYFFVEFENDSDSNTENDTKKFSDGLSFKGFEM